MGHEPLGAGTGVSCRSLAIAAVGGGLALGIAGRLTGGGAFLLGAATFAAVTAAILQQALP